MGRLDVVVSNAGYTRLTNFMDFEQQHLDEDWDKCFLFNVKAHMWLAYACKEHLDKTEGAFITTASVAGIKPSGSSLAYAVTKAASIHLTKCLASICAPKIRCNAVSPGLMLTEWGMKFSEQKREAHKNNTKLKKLPEVDVSFFFFFLSFRVFLNELLMFYLGCRRPSPSNCSVEEYDWPECCC
jgi:NAD(P)-dependent dehydrogenase (short-subunit alcohol dehydrogenase family)